MTAAVLEPAFICFGITLGYVGLILHGSVRLLHDVVNAADMDRAWRDTTAGGTYHPASIWIVHRIVTAHPNDRHRFPGRGKSRKPHA